MFEVLFSLYLLAICGFRTYRLWQKDPIDTIAWLQTFGWALGTLASAILLLLAVF